MTSGAARRFMDLVVRHRLVCLCLAILLGGAGYYGMINIDRDSFPDMTPVRVEVDTQTSGMAAEEVEKLVSYPIEQALLGIPNAEKVQSTSKFSLSVVEVHFKPGTDLYWARSQVFQNLGNASLPAGVVPNMAPMDEGTGQVFIYTLTSKTLDNVKLRTLQDFLMKPILRAVPGVADVPMFGGYVLQYQVIVDPLKLTGLGLGVSDVMNALNNNNSSVGGNYLNRGSTQYVIRGLGMVHTLDDIRGIIVANPHGIPIRIGDLAEVRLGHEDRQGAVSVNGQGEVVAGIVIKRIGENTAEVIGRVKLKLAELEKTMDAGDNLGIDSRDVKVVTLYDQSYLIDQSTETVISSLLEGAGLVMIILVVFMGSFRAAFIPILANLFCVLTAFGLMKYYHISANLLSLGGIALSLGMMVDATVMILENVYRHVYEVEHIGFTHTDDISEGASEILLPTVLAVLVIIAVFLPVLSLNGIEGQLFTPLALAVVFSMVGSLIFSVLITPALCFWLIKPGSKGQGHYRPNIIMRFLHYIYRPMLNFSVRQPWVIILISALILVLSVVTLSYTGSEFLPPLEEGNIRLRVTLPPSVSLPFMMSMTKRIEQLILDNVPEATEVISYVGRPELGGDPEAISNDEIHIGLKPAKQWPPGISKDAIQDKLRATLSQIPGATVQFSQELEMRTDEMISGFNTPIALYVLGNDPEVMLDTARKVKDILATVPGATDTGIEHFTGIDNLDVIPDRSKMAEFGATTSNVLDVVASAVAGGQAGQVLLQNERFDIIVRVRQDYRSNAEVIRKLLVNCAGGAKVPLEDVADVHYDNGFEKIDRYNGRRRIVVMADVKGRSVGSVVEDAKAKLDKDLKLPGGITLFWGGQAEEASHAFTSLTVAIPGALLVVFVLIYACFDNIRDTFIVLASIPLGLAGGTFLLMFMHLHLNVPAYIGFIAKFGIAVQNGMIMVTYMNKLARDGMTSAQAAVQASIVRLRPELLSGLIGSIGLIPFLLSAGTGATVERPLAAVVVGGVLVSRPVAWFLIPALYAWLKRGSDPEAALVPVND